MAPEFVTPVMSLAVIAGGSYLLGSIAFGLVVTRLMGLADLRSIGSGNIGTSNVLRTGSRAAALLTLVLDMGKGLVPVLATATVLGTDDAMQCAALSAFLGHLYPVWHSFRGGKGVATFFGVIAVLAPAAAVLCALVWLLMAALFRISSLAALTATAVFPVAAIVMGHASLLVLSLLLAALIWYRHRSNIMRLLEGTEPRITFRSKS
ncbi:MAG: glycerol-3-phosphate 1-O-acyltransferase PlsY [Rhodobacteraceae bacterium]|nr:glycerol-3-phosphate 1-O-acyltransferase PlsY [Paracoccaceae bacterium]